MARTNRRYRVRYINVGNRFYPNWVWMVYADNARGVSRTPFIIAQTLDKALEVLNSRLTRHTAMGLGAELMQLTTEQLHDIKATRTLEQIKRDVNEPNPLYSQAVERGLRRNPITGFSLDSPAPMYLPPDQALAKIKSGAKPVTVVNDDNPHPYYSKDDPRRAVPLAMRHLTPIPIDPTQYHNPMLEGWASDDPNVLPFGVYHG